MLPDNFRKAELVEALETLQGDEDRRKMLGKRALEILREEHAPKKCGKKYLQAIEKYYAEKMTKNENLQELKTSELELIELKSMALKAEVRVREAEERTRDALHHYHRVTHSLSWKITKPLRYFMKNIKSILETKS
jgi:succinate dehydrogenase/fumarate reductase flavoprotein subunit